MRERVEKMKEKVEGGRGRRRWKRVDCGGDEGKVGGYKEGCEVLHHG